MGRAASLVFRFSMSLLSVWFEEIVALYKRPLVGTAVCICGAWVLIKWEALALSQHLRAALTGAANRLSMSWLVILDGLGD
jgi:hypothetical protein